MTDCSERDNLQRVHVGSLENFLPFRAYMSEACKKLTRRLPFALQVVSPNWPITSKDAVADPTRALKSPRTMTRPFPWKPATSSKRKS
ncbi:hypothetical protein COCOBI_02-1270 [Coccomyxa sp. Obi]|nr:hypothetical protein COCOBI_02-1270 [Coccomyxa sp. Obi]